MIVLNRSNRTLQLLLGGAVNTNECPWGVAYTDIPATPQIGPEVDGETLGNTTGATAVTIMSAPPDSNTTSSRYTRRLRSLNFNNADLAAVTVSVRYNDNGTTYVLFKVTLQTLEQLQYQEGNGFEILDANGAIKSQAAQTSSATSEALSAGVSAGTRASTADSKAVSNSVLISGSGSANTSQSVLISTGASANTSQSVLLSALTSRVSSNE